MAKKQANKKITNLENSVAIFLKDSNNFKLIKFTYRGQNYSSREFSIVGDAISANSIQVILATKGEKTGTYLIEKDTIVIAREEDPIQQRGLIVHEAIHAFHDIQGKRMSLVQDELAAFTAQSIYEIKNGRKFADGTVPKELYSFFYTKNSKHSIESLEEYFAGILSAIENPTRKGTSLYDITATNGHNGLAK